MTEKNKIRMSAWIQSHVGNVDVALNEAYYGDVKDNRAEILFMLKKACLTADKNFPICEFHNMLREYYDNAADDVVTDSYLQCLKDLRIEIDNESLFECEEYDLFVGNFDVEFPKIMKAKISIEDVLKLFECEELKKNLAKFNRELFGKKEEK